MEKYRSVIAALVTQDARAEFHSPGQLVVCLEEPVLAGGIWITWQGRWFISTWTPAIYWVPEDIDIVELCLACVRWEGDPFHTIPDPIATRFRLRRLDQSEVDELNQNWDTQVDETIQ